jgi:hypothetical protein
MFSLPSLLSKTTAAVLVTAAAVAPACAVTITTGSYANSGIGAEFQSPYDNFLINGTSIVVAAGQAPIQVTLGTYSFEVGPNCWSCTLTPSVDALIDITVDGMTRQLDLPYSWSSSGPYDTLSFATPAPVLFDFGALGMVTVAVAAIDVLQSGGAVMQGNVYAAVSTTPVPEPTVFGLMLAGLGVIGFVAKRRRR